MRVIVPNACHEYFVSILPPQAIEKDNTMIYGDSPAFDKLIQRIVELQERFRNYMNIKK